MPYMEYSYNVEYRFSGEIRNDNIVMNCHHVTNVIKTLLNVCLHSTSVYSMIEISRNPFLTHVLIVRKQITLK
jgi:hypothetical protein